MGDLSITNTDDAPADVVLAQLAFNASCWERGARLVGNIRAGDIVRAVDEKLAASPSSVSVEEIVRVLNDNATMLEKQAPEIFPDVNEHGQVHFGRAIMESAAEELRALLSKLKSPSQKETE
jgi:DNA-binding IscR family transcriptional regulator